MSVQLLVGLYGQPYRPTNSLRPLHGLPTSGFPFDICTWIWFFEEEEEVHHTGTWLGLPEADPLVKQPLHTTNGSTSEKRPSYDGGLRPFGVAHGIGRREVKVVGDHHSGSAPREGHQVPNGDGRHVWVKLCTPAGLNLFEKPCSRL